MERKKNGDEKVVNSCVASCSITDNFASYSSYDYNIASPGDVVGITAEGLWVTINFTAGTGGEVYTFTRWTIVSVRLPTK